MRYSVIIAIALLSSMIGCKVPHELNPVGPVNTPQVYRSDTTFKDSLALVKWRSYFKDPRLVSLIDTAMRLNIDLQIANQRVFIAQANLSASKGAMFPQVRASGWAGAIQYGDFTEQGVGNFDTNKSPNISSEQQIPDPVQDYYVGLGASWETGIWGKYRNRKRGQFNRFLASQYGRQLVTTRLVAEVASLYYELLALDRELEIIRSFILLQERAVEAIHVQKQSGRITELAVKQFEAQLLRVKALEGVKRQEILATENTLNILLGRYAQPIDRKDTIDLNDLPPLISAGVPSEMLLNRPDIRQAESAFIASDYELKSARAAFYPSIVITANAGMNAFKSSLWFRSPDSFAFSILGGLTAPILNRYQVMATYRNAYATRNQSFLEFQRTILIGVGEVSTELNRVMNYRRVSNLKAQEVNTLIDAVNISNDLFFTGYATYIEVLIARQNRLESEIQLTEARKRQFLAAVALYRALGGGWE
jgi:multidrug efflux system outer membrane protein